MTSTSTKSEYSVNLKVCALYRKTGITPRADQVIQHVSPHCVTAVLRCKPVIKLASRAPLLFQVPGGLIPCDTVSIELLH